VVSGSAHEITHIIGGNILTGIANAGYVSKFSMHRQTPLS
jgi:hypothetical protein